jgi:hypothetical protein
MGILLIRLLIYWFLLWLVFCFVFCGKFCVLVGLVFHICGVLDW